VRALVVCLTLVTTACTCGGKVQQVPEGFTADPQLLDFGTLRPGESKTLDVIVTNTGKLAVRIQPGLGSADFSTQADAVALEPGASAALPVVFHPSQEGLFMASLELVSGSSSLGVDLTGRAQGGVTSCTPTTCAEQGRSCGAADDGCGHALSCGSCSGPLACSPKGFCACPGDGREACGNGTDDDCDGAIDCSDSDCAGLGSCMAAACSAGVEVRITHGAFGAGGADVAWSGTEFGVAYMTVEPGTPSQKLDFAFARVSAAGALVGSPRPITTTGLMAHQPRLAWNSGEWAIASSTIASDGSMNLVEVRRVDASGAATGTPLVLGQGWPAAIAPRPSSSAFGVLWGSVHTPAFTEVAAGARTGSDTLVNVTPTWMDYGDLTWNGSGWGAAWTQTDLAGAAGAWFVRFDSAGAQLGAPLKLSLEAPYAGNPRIAWSGTHYGVVWVENGPPPRQGVQFARIDASGAVVDAPVGIGPPNQSGAPDIVWTGTAFAIVWEDARGPKPAIWLALYDPQGRKVGNDRRVSCGAADSRLPSVTWAGDALGVTWHDTRHSTAKPDVYFKREVP